MKHLRLFAVALAALAMVSLTGCQAISEHSQLYQMKQAEKAAKAKQAADKAYYDQRAVDTSVAYNAWIEEVEQKRKAWKAKHPGEPYYSLPWSAAPGAKRVEIGGKSYYCAPTETGGIHCE